MSETIVDTAQTACDSFIDKCRKLTKCISAGCQINILSKEDATVLLIEIKSLLFDAAVNGPESATILYDDFITRQAGKEFMNLLPIMADCKA